MKIWHTTKHVIRILHSHARELVKIARSSEWRKVRKEWLKNNPRCAACGATKGVQVHHISPFHDHPELELKPKNFITLCEILGGPEHHLQIGHGGDFKARNPYVVSDAAALLANPSKESEIIKRAQKNRLTD